MAGPEPFESELPIVRQAKASSSKSMAPDFFDRSATGVHSLRAQDCQLARKTLNRKIGQAGGQPRQEACDVVRFSSHAESGYVRQDRALAPPPIGSMLSEAQR